MLLRAFVVWMLMLGAAIANGAVREAVIVPRLGSYAAHVISTLLLSVLIVAIATASLGWIAPAPADLLGVGVLWLMLTLGFEFIAGHYLFGNPWERLLEDYNVLAGRIWLLVLVVTALAPMLAARLRQLT
jgi:hypothetical protein